MNSSAHPYTCPCCGHTRQPFRIVGEKGCIRLMECPACQFVFADRAVWKNPYEAIDYYDPSKQPVENYPLKVTATDWDRLTMLRKCGANGKLLEFGGGLGRTALAAAKLGFEVTIVEESERAVADGSRHHPEVTWVRASEIPAEFPPGSFSVVTIFHVLEHIPEPGRLIETFARILRPGGHLLVEVPNWGSKMRMRRGMDWVYVLDHHLNQFTRDTLKRLIEPRGFALEAVAFRRTFAINEKQPWKEPLKRIAAALGYGDVLRCLFRRT